MSEQDDDLEVVCCMACAKQLVEGDRVYRELEGGFIHAECCGDDPESFFDEDGKSAEPRCANPGAVDLVCGRQHCEAAWLNELIARTTVPSKRLRFISPPRVRHRFRA